MVTTSKPLGVPLTAGMVAFRHILPYQQDFFRQKFKREPVAGDPVFFDFHAILVQPMPKQKVVGHLIQLLEQTGAPQLVINELHHAQAKTSYPDDLERWLNRKSPIQQLFDSERTPLYPSIFERVQSIQSEAFTEIYHREPEPNDSLFFDPLSPTPKPYPVEASLVRIMAMLESYLDTSIEKPTLLYDLSRITHPVLYTLLNTLRTDT